LIFANGVSSEATK